MSSARQPSAKLSQRLRQDAVTAPPAEELPVPAWRHRAVDQAEVRRQRQADAVARHLEHSGTRQLLDFFFLGALVTVGLHFLLGLIGQRGFVQIVEFLPRWFCLPLTLVWRPDPAFWQLGPLTVDKIELAIWPIYAILYGVLRYLHLVVTIERTQVS
ncbi:MAG: hypothetical protein IT204_11535 [Fimbriimonadaceae bacterium]|nr:hypothetical protein [Fimbriimonadaceae bacterium]